MTHLAVSHLVVVGPYLDTSNHDYPGQYDLVFRRGEVNPLVGQIYQVCNNFAQSLGVDVSFPVAPPETDPRALWVDAIHRLASADAVFVIYDGQSQAIPLEAALARQMDLPLLVATTDPGSAAFFKEATFPVINAQLGQPAIEQSIRTLLGQGTASDARDEETAIPETQYDSDFWRDVDDEGV